MATDHFDIISLTADTTPYYAASMEDTGWMPEEYVKHTEIDIPLGHSRYGGPVMDLPPGLDDLPNDEIKYAGQLNLEQIAPHDRSGLLPKTGHLIFFCDLMTESGKVIYADIPTQDLERKYDEHEDNFFLGVLVDQAFPDTETWEERFGEPEDEDYDEDEEPTPQEEGKKAWDYFAGSERSKLFGIFTHVQWSQEEIEEMTNSEWLVLWQVGENGFNDEGVFTVLITRDDLKKKDFSNCKFHWAQT